MKEWAKERRKEGKKRKEVREAEKSTNVSKIRRKKKMVDEGRKEIGKSKERTKRNSEKGRNKK